MPEPVIFNDEERKELIALLEERIDQHGDTVAALASDDSTEVELFRKAVADEYRRNKIHNRLLAMLKGGK